MIYITVSPKGGVGKSTFSNQILSSYLFDKKNEKIKLIEIDDENTDNESLSKTEIMNCSIFSTKDIKKIDEIFFDNEDVIIDIGGNKTATIFLNEMKKINEFENVTWFVPLGTGEQDNLNAYETYYKIKDLDENANVIFVLSKATTNDLEFEFLNFFGHEFLNINFPIFREIENVKYIVIKSSTIINNARYFNKTVYDLSLNITDFRAKAKAEEDKEKRRKLIFMNRVKNEAIEFVNYLKDDVFIELDKLLIGV